MLRNNLAIVTVGILALGIELRALNVDTHRLINIEAANNSQFDEYLRQSLGWPQGRNTTLREPNFTPAALLGEGGEREDDSGFFRPLSGRFLNHFDNPLNPWSDAGLHFVGQHESSIEWMQNRNQSPAGHWSWSDARQLYLQALTTADARARQEAAADLFRGLGQIMHLVVDASVPEHTRDDPHPMGEIRRQLLGQPKAGNYEYWVSDQHTGADGAVNLDAQQRFRERFLSNPIGFDKSILRIPPPTGETVATVPIARLIDADKYTADAPDPNVTLGSAIGLAEFANANFFSEDTLNGSFPFPRRDLLTPNLRLAPRSPNVRRYFAKPAGQGLPLNVAMAECVSETTVGTWVVHRSAPYRCVDDAVWEETASYMLPRAVGYARGVLDYFFRGSIAVTSVEWTPEGVMVSVRNTGEEDMDGVFEIYARYQAGTSQERRVKFASLDDGARIALGAGEDWTGAIAVPLDAVATPSYVLVFKGRLGLEEDAVAGQIFTVPYVDIRQTTYNADVAPECAPLPHRQASQPYEKGATLSIVSDVMRCDWRINGHRVSGTLQTNMPVDPATNHREPIIDRIEASWIGGGAGGPAPLIVDGRDVDSVWQRTASELDPTTFEIIDSTYRGWGYLYLWVSYADGHEIQAQMATFTDGTSTHAKSIWIDNTKPLTPRYLVAAGRGVSGGLAYNWLNEGQMKWPLFEAVTIGGVTVPLDAQSPRTFGAAGFLDGLFVDEQNYNDNATDQFQIFTSRTPADTFYAGIELLGPHPDGPFFNWTAEVRRRYQPMEREFLRAFVTNAPEPFVVELSGAEAD